MVNVASFQYFDHSNVVWDDSKLLPLLLIKTFENVSLISSHFNIFK